MLSEARVQGGDAHERGHENKENFYNGKIYALVALREIVTTQPSHALRSDNEEREQSFPLANLSRSDE
jgi:hypothetical protein